MLMPAKTSLTINQTLNNSGDHLNIWAQSALFAANKNRSDSVKENDTLPKEEVVSVEYEENIPNYLNDY